MAGSGCSTASSALFHPSQTMADSSPRCMVRSSHAGPAAARYQPISCSLVPSTTDEHPAMNRATSRAPGPSVAIAQSRRTRSSPSKAMLTVARSPWASVDGESWRAATSGAGSSSSPSTASATSEGAASSNSSHPRSASRMSSTSATLAARMRRGVNRVRTRSSGARPGGAWPRKARWSEATAAIVRAATSAESRSSHVRTLDPRSRSTRTVPSPSTQPSTTA